MSLFQTLQSKCGASYAFSAMAALEGANALATGSLSVLSEQNIIDCSGKKQVWSMQGMIHLILCIAVPYGNHGCKGGNMNNAFKYVIANEGVDTAKSYPFYGIVSHCSYTWVLRYLRIPHFSFILLP